MRSFGKNLRALLKQRNISARQLAKTTDIAVTSLNDWIDSDDKLPRDAIVIKKLASFFDISTHELLFGENDPKSFIGEILEKTEIHTGLYEITVKKVLPKKGVKGN